MAAHYDTRNDPRHYTARDGAVRPVLGTHRDGEECPICANGRASARILPESFPLGALVRWRYGARDSFAHGRVIGHGRTRVEVFWHAARRPRGIKLAVDRLERIPPGTPNPWRRCASCEART